MEIQSVLRWLQETSVANGIRNSLLLFPLLEAVHVFGLALVVGTITVIDLRLLGLASTRRPFHVMAADILKWTWVAFGITVFAGALMFTTNAQVYFANFYFRMKVGLLALAGLNVLLFHLTAYRRLERWDRERSAPAVGRFAAAASLVIWIAIIVSGRMIGFTTTRAAAPEPAPEVDLEELLFK